MLHSKLRCPAVHSQCLSPVTLIINWSLFKKIETAASDSMGRASFVTCGVAFVCRPVPKISNH